MKKQKLFTLIVALIMAATIPAIAFAGTTSINSTGNLALVAGQTSDIQAGSYVATADTKITPATRMAMIENPARLQATVENPATIPQVTCNNCHADAITGKQGTQTSKVMKGDDNSGGGYLSVEKVLASSSTMMIGTYYDASVAAHTSHDAGPAHLIA